MNTTGLDIKDFEVEAGYWADSVEIPVTGALDECKLKENDINSDCTLRKIMGTVYINLLEFSYKRDNIVSGLMENCDMYYCSNGCILIIDDTGRIYKMYRSVYESSSYNKLYSIGLVISQRIVHSNLYDDSRELADLLNIVLYIKDDKVMPCLSDIGINDGIRYPIFGKCEICALDSNVFETIIGEYVDYRFEGDYIVLNNSTYIFNGIKIHVDANSKWNGRTPSGNVILPNGCKYAYLWDNSTKGNRIESLVFPSSIVNCNTEFFKIPINFSKSRNIYFSSKTSRENILDMLGLDKFDGYADISDNEFLREVNGLKEVKGLSGLSGISLKISLY